MPPKSAYQGPTPMELANRPLRTLRHYERTSFGVWQSLPGTNFSRILARSGVDWVVIDMEHGNIDDAAMFESVAAIAAGGASPIVRVAQAESWMIKRALDSGAHGIIVPKLHTAEEARRVVQEAYFPPEGCRGFGSPYPLGPFQAADINEYFDKVNKNILVAIQIETAQAVKEVEEIAKIPGVDILFVGMFDLGNSLGCPLIGAGNSMGQQMKDTIVRIIKLAKLNGKFSGVYAVQGESAKEFVSMGFDFVSIVPDVACIEMALKGHLTAAKGKL